MLYRLFLFAAFVTAISSCSKSNDDNGAQPSNSDAFKQEAVTKLSFLTILNGNPTQVQLHYKGARLNIFENKTGGAYKIEFHGKNGRLLLEGNPRNAASFTNLAIWSIPTGDTIRVFKNGNKYRDYVTEPEDNINDGIIYSVLSGQAIDQVRSGGNSFTAPGGAMTTILFKPLE